MYYFGITKKLPGLLHHNLFFDADFDRHADDIYTRPGWPEDPVIYVACTSKTDPGVAPGGNENLAIMIPVAPGLQDSAAIREQYYEYCINKLEQYTGESVRNSVVVKEMYGHSRFIEDYHSFKGNAYGLANTLMQTAFLKPRMKSRKVSNLYFTGQLTVPGPGVPPALISGEIAAGVIAGRHR
jgi:phytoene desaturase